ncbi:hypothetical protein GOQ27_13765 [Clostridium sp. D2Q-11]|uniref:Polymer-forming cytoskeletal n=1 Tax=Anaeromonas frigoriresistens TaxID=2683708 RepID=A0A942UUW0_9FIRM|nr:hypothetical protein [Anaeromonas frigoriresistens]MBS4539538.1 hypothetical protein [Anaeromonas frigoriresistens]
MYKKISILVILTLLIFTSVAFAVDNEIYGDKISIFEDINISEGTTLGGTVVSIFGDVNIEGDIDGDVVTIFGSLDLDGEVDGSTVTIFGNVDMSSDALITGDKVQIFGRSNVISPRSQIGGGEVSILANDNFVFGNMITGFSGLLFLIFIIVFIKALFGFIGSVIFVLVAPEKMNKITDATVVNIPRRFGIGLLVMIIYWLFLTIGSAIIIGIPVILLLLPLMTIAGVGGNTAIKIAIGRKVGSNSSWTIMTQLIVGSLIYLLLELTLIIKPILYLGKLLGIGAIVDTKFGTVEYFNDNQYIKNYPPRDNENNKL